MSQSISPDRQSTNVVALDGRVDLMTAQAVKERIRAAVAGGAKLVIVDLAAVEFIDSSGLGAIVAGLKAARQAGGHLRIAAPNQQVRLVLQLTTLDRVLHPYPTVDDARAPA